MTLQGRLSILPARSPSGAYRGSEATEAPGRVVRPGRSSAAAIRIGGDAGEVLGVEGEHVSVSDFYHRVS